MIEDATNHQLFSAALKLREELKKEIHDMASTKQTFKGAPSKCDYGSVKSTKPGAECNKRNN